MLRVVAALEQAAVDFRVQRLQAAVEKLRRTGEIRDIDDRQPRLTQRGGSAAGGEQFHSHGVEFLGEFGQAGLIGNGEKGAGDWHKIGLSRW